MNDAITATELRETLSYDPATGRFHWLVARPRCKAGSEAGSIKQTGYCTISVNRVAYLAHRLAWLYVHGRWPDGYIDHVNCDEADNRIANLRECNASQNVWNCRKSRANTSGFKGVSRNRGRWIATARGIYIGVFPTPEAAHAAYVQKSNELFGEYARAA